MWRYCGPCQVEWNSHDFDCWACGKRGEYGKISNSGLHIARRVTPAEILYRNG